jgi:FMN-dependent NADH-azoreductase
VKTLLVMAAVVAAGCTGSSHLTENFGKSYRETMRAQHTGDAALAKQAVKGLDSEEATIVASSYRKSLAPKGQTSDAQPEILYVAPQRDGGQTQLAPSVPQER